MAVPVQSGFHKRTILSLEGIRNVEFRDVIQSLESPLGLARKLVDRIFSGNGEGLREYRSNLDATKRMALGLLSAELSYQRGDKLAEYGIYQFAFQQFVQSSFRARQGIVLQRVLERVLKPYLRVIDRKALRSTGIPGDVVEKHDLDLLLRSPAGDLVVIQIRSRDDTGGATAKASLAEAPKDFRKYGLGRRLLYLIYVWEPLDESQRGTLARKVGGVLDLSGEDVDALEKGEILDIGGNIRVGVAYGSRELFSTLSRELGVEIDADRHAGIVEATSRWDDLWMSYAVATIELENLVTVGKTNAKLLNELVGRGVLKIGLDDARSYEGASVRLAKEMAVYWKDDLIPFTSLSDKMNYLRDLILLRMVYDYGVRL